MGILVRQDNRNREQKISWVIGVREEWSMSSVVFNKVSDFLLNNGYPYEAIPIDSGCVLVKINEQVMFKDFATMKKVLASLLSYEEEFVK